MTSAKCAVVISCSKLIDARQVRLNPQPGRGSADALWAMSRRPGKSAFSDRSTDPPSLVRRFALYAGAALLLAAVAAFFFVREYATKHAEQTAVAHTEYIAESVLPSRLRSSDFGGPVDAGRRRELDRISRRLLLSPGILRVKLYAPDGRVVYSSDHQLIGTRPDDFEEIPGIMGGKPTSDVTKLNAEGGTGPDTTVLESYVAVGTGGRPDGVLELYADYGPIASDARSIFIPLAIGITILLLGLYLSFFPILKRVTRTLRGQMQEIEHKAHHDALTNLPNRSLFNDRAAQAVREANAHDTRLAVMLIDLDRFKDVNDTLGHASGDRLLRALAADLPSHMRPTDTVARLGGDEFGILATEIRDATAVLALAAKVRTVLGHPRRLDGVELAVDASIGIALFPDHGADVETLIRRADVAMYRSKELHAPALYESEHDHYSPARLSLAAELQRAIANRELTVEYQPQCEPASGELRGVEALVRWHHHRHGLLTPDEFVPLAEHTGSVRQLTGYVLDVSVRQCRSWQEAGRQLRVAVNVSARDLLDSRFPDEVEAILRRWNADPAQLELEITEKSALVDLPRAREILARLNQLGVGLTIDDFGTGNSSLAYFRHLPVDTLKIDKSFVMRMLDSEADAAIVRSTIALAHDLGLRVIAEGVEGADCNRVLADLGCDLVQGFFYGRAVPSESIGPPSSAPTLRRT
jgi:diguanylate cyclase (GGDEF)-like protein